MLYRSKSLLFISIMLSAAAVDFWHADEMLDEAEVVSGRQKACSDKPAAAGKMPFIFPPDSRFA